MTVYAALLRAVDVGETDTLPMAALEDLCRKCGFSAPTTFLASSNVVFESAAGEARVRQALERALSGYCKKPAHVALRTAGELALIRRANPFTTTNPAQTVVVFLDEAPDPTSLSAASGWAGEEARLGKREIYIHYGSGMSRSRLRIPAARNGTARSLNTVAKVASLAERRSQLQY